MAEAKPVPGWKRTVARWVAWPPIHAALCACIWIAAPRHRVGAVVVLFNDENRLLLVEHLYHPDEPWGLPGGWVGPGESPQEAARRELLEETRFEVEIGPLVHMERSPRPWHLSIAFTGRLLGGDLHLSGELLDAVWVDPEHLPDGLSSFVRRAVETAVILDWESR